MPKQTTLGLFLGHTSYANQVATLHYQPDNKEVRTASTKLHIIFEWCGARAENMGLNSAGFSG